VAENFDVDALLARLDRPTFPVGQTPGSSTGPGETAGTSTFMRRGLQRIAERASRLGGVSRE
jgi:hypothetical protein